MCLDTARQPDVDTAREQKKLEAAPREMLAVGVARPTGSPTLPALRPKGVSKGQCTIRVPAEDALFVCLLLD
jgi:hypothetical protein